MAYFKIHEGGVPTTRMVRLVERTAIVVSEPR